MKDPGADPLLSCLAAGDERAFAALYDRYAVRMFRIALRILGNREDAEDVVQEVFMATIRCRERLSEVRDLAAYVFTALHHTATRYAMNRPRLRIASVVDIEQTEARMTKNNADNPYGDRLQQAIRALPPIQQEVLSLKIDGELTFAQIAQVLGVGVSTVSSRYQYALKKLRSSLLTAKTTIDSPSAANGLR